MIGLDTNVLLRYIVRDNEPQSALAARLMAGLSAEQPGFVSTVAMIETVWTLLAVYEFSRDELSAALEGLLAVEGLTFQNHPQVVAALAALLDGSGSFPDTLIAELGLWAGCTTTYTFDRKASRLRGFTLIQ